VTTSPMETARRAIPILMYHSVAPDTTPTYAPFTVTPAEFAEHISALITGGWRIATFDEAAHRLRSTSTNGSTSVSAEERLVVVTADDGLRDFAAHAVPELVKAHASATLFVPTAYVGGRAAFMDGEDGQRATLDWVELRGLREAGLELGSHGHRHLAMDRTKSDLLRSELRRSRELLQDQIGIEITSLAYPYGYQTRRVREIVRDVGFTAACSVTDLHATDVDETVALPRLHVLPGTTGDALLKRLEAPKPWLLRRVVRGEFSVFYAGRPWVRWGQVPVDGPMTGLPRWTRA